MQFFWEIISEMGSSVCWVPPSGKDTFLSILCSPPLCLEKALSFPEPSFPICKRGCYICLKRLWDKLINPQARASLVSSPWVLLWGSVSWATGISTGLKWAGLCYIISFSPPPTPDPSLARAPTQGIAVLESHRWPGLLARLERVDSGYRSAMGVFPCHAPYLCMAARGKSRSTCPG